MDITSERNIQGMDITCERHEQGTDTGSCMEISLMDITSQCIAMFAEQLTRTFEVLVKKHFLLDPTSYENYSI